MEDVIKIIEENISLIRNKENKLSRIKSAMYREAAIAIHGSNETSNIDDVRRIFELVSGKNLIEIDATDLALFSLELSKKVGNELGTIGHSAINESSTATIAYMQNSYSDTAYRKFSSNFKRAGAVYFPGFREVCEEVYYGRCTHAIVPIYTSKDGQLLSFRKLISKYELKIVAECNVEMNDDSIMRHALLKKGVCADSNTKYIDLSVILPDHIKAGDFIRAFEILGGNVVMINSIPLEYSDEKFTLDFILEMDNMNLSSLYLFLELSQISYDIIGLYSVLHDDN